MNIQVNPHTITITRSVDINAGEYNVTTCVFQFSEEYDDLTKQAVFSTCDSTYKVPILNNQCTIPSEVLETSGQVLLGVYGYESANDELFLRYSPTPQYFNVSKGSYKEGNDPDLPEPSEWEQVLALINQAITETNNLNIEVNKEEHITTVTLTKKDGTQEEVEILDGEDGISLESIEIKNRDLYVTYGGSESDLGQVAPNIQIGTTTTGTPSTQASVVNVGTDLNPILNFTIPKGEAGSIKFEIVEQLPTQDIKEDTIYLVPYTKITVQTLPTENIQLHTIYIVESTGKRYVYNGNEWIEISSDNQYIEYVYINNSWEELGSIGVDINLDDYYTKTETNNLLDTKVGFTDYATASVGGVIKTNNAYGVDIYQGTLMGLERTYSQYESMGNKAFISKRILENVITGKGLVSNTDYASQNTGGVVRIDNVYAVGINNVGKIYATAINYSDYGSADISAFISKKTLDNVLNATIGDINSVLDTINGEVI